MCQQKIVISESPKNRDTRHSAVLCRHHIHVAVADIYRPVSIRMQLAQGFVYGIRSRFFLDILPLSYRHIYQVAEEMAADFLVAA